MKPGLVTGLQRTDDLLAMDDIIPSRHHYSSSAWQISPDKSKAEGEFGGYFFSLIVGLILLSPNLYRRRPVLRLEGPAHRSAGRSGNGANLLYIWRKFAWCRLRNGDGRFPG
ncbi:hypothetical protein SPHINGOR109_20093 [Sphingorhabdus sp. 109]|nr:hypothetical protein SPHINGOR109_20093 [Sphingorhabdus sp. 109]